MASYAAMDENDDRYVENLRPRASIRFDPPLELNGPASVLVDAQPYRRPDDPLYGKSATMMFVDEALPRTDGSLYVQQWGRAPDRAEIGHLAMLAARPRPRYRFAPGGMCCGLLLPPVWLLVDLECPPGVPRVLFCKS